MMYAVGATVLGVAVFPSIYWVTIVWQHTAAWAMIPRLFALAVAGAAGYFLFGFCLIFTVALLRLLLRLDLKEGEYPLVSLGMVRWMIVNALMLLVVTSFGDFILATPVAPLFFRLMGARVGKGVQINSGHCADFCLLELGDHSVIGGHATVIAHSVERGKLILKKVKIGKNVVIGLNSIVLPGAEIGDGAIVAAGAVVPKNAKIPAGSIYLGV
jgi:hypothetical protein